MALPAELTFEQLERLESVRCPDCAHAPGDHSGGGICWGSAGCGCGRRDLELYEPVILALIAESVV